MFGNDDDDDGVENIQQVEFARRDPDETDFLQHAVDLTVAAMEASGKHDYSSYTSDTCLAYIEQLYVGLRDIVRRAK